MNVLVDEWIQKAEGDWHTAQRELRARKDPNYDATCFHSQQCAEKYLKAFLQRKEQHFPKTHNLTELLELTLAHDKEFEFYRDILEALNRFSVVFRYPGEEASRSDARQAAQYARSFRDYVRAKLGVVD